MNDINFEKDQEEVLDRISLSKIEKRRIIGFVLMA